jgi:hypothetical protein
LDDNHHASHRRTTTTTMQPPTYRLGRQALTTLAALALTAFIFFVCVNVLEEEWKASKAIVWGCAEPVVAAGQGVGRERVLFVLIMVGLESAVEGAMGIKVSCVSERGRWASDGRALDLSVARWLSHAQRSSLGPYRLNAEHHSCLMEQR